MEDGLWVVHSLVTAGRIYSLQLNRFDLRDLLAHSFAEGRATPMAE